jgi:hypothetical protein
MSLWSWRPGFLDTGRRFGGMMLPSMIRFLTGSTALLAPMGQIHAIAVASDAVRPSISATPRAMKPTQTG